MWSPDFLGHRVFQEVHLPKSGQHMLMNIDDTMISCSVRQIIGSVLGGGNLTSSCGTYVIPAAIAKRPIPGGAFLTGLICVSVALLGFPMDLAMWQPVLAVALIVGVFLPLLEAGLSMIKEAFAAQTAVICIFACVLVNPVFGWALTMLLENSGLTGNTARSQALSSSDRWIIPLLTLGGCLLILGSVGQLPDIAGVF